MKKVKKIWEENKVLLVLAVILIVCIVIVVVVAITYFYGSSNNVYGNRLDITEQVPLSNNLLTNIESKLESDKTVTSVSATLKGRIVYIKINFENGTEMSTAKMVAETTIEEFSEEELKVYDIQIIIETNEYTLMGARNTSGSGSVVWNNYNIETDSEEESA